MAWTNVWSNDRIEVRYDDGDRTAMIEVNDGGLVPAYMTLSLEKAELDELLGALNRVRRLMDE